MAKISMIYKHLRANISKKFICSFLTFFYLLKKGHLSMELSEEAN